MADCEWGGGVGERAEGRIVGIKLNFKSSHNARMAH
jgi:hypothetical protein